MCIRDRSSWAALICRTHQHYHGQWLPNTEWSNYWRSSWATDRWLWRKTLRKGMFHKKSGKRHKNVNNPSRIKAWRWGRSEWWWCTILVRKEEACSMQKWGAACQKERFVVFRMEWTDGCNRVTNMHVDDREGWTAMRLRRLRKCGEKEELIIMWRK